MVTRPGRKGYYADFRVNGERIQKKLGTDFDAAKSKLIELRARAERGEFNLLDNNYLLKDLKEAYLKKCAQELRASSASRYRECLDRVLGRIGVQKVGQLNVARVLDYREQRLREACPSTINLEVLLLGGMLAWGVKQGLIGSNPVRGIKPLPHDHKKEGRALTDDEVRRLLDRSRQPWRDIWYAFLVTGLRKEELAGLLFSDVDWDARELIVRTHHAKGKKPRRVPVDDGLWDILQRQKAEAPARRPGTHNVPKTAAQILKRFTREHVFATKAGTPVSGRSLLYEAFMRCCAQAGIETATYGPDGRLVEHVDVHSLRRTFATNAIVNGADPKSVQEILGHKTLKMTMEIYAKVKAGPKRQAVAKLSYAAGATPPGHVLPFPPAANG
jgi:integrase